MAAIELKVIDTKACGKLNVYIQGNTSMKDVVILALHDMGCNHNEFVDFLAHEDMEQLGNRCMWLLVDVPGQGDSESDLPSDYQFPTMQELAEAMGEICDKLEIKHVVVFGEGAGANVLARLPMIREDLVLGAVLIHCTGTTAGFAETMRDKLIGWKLNTVGMNATTEAYLQFHRFGTFSDVEDELELKSKLEAFRNSLRSSINPKNLNKFITSFMSRTKILDKVDQITCPVLFMTGSFASHNHTVHRLYNAVKQSLKDHPHRRAKVELMQVDDVANVLRERPEKVADSLQYFIQGLGLAGGVVNRRMSSTISVPYSRERSMSMEKYDQPKGVSYCLYDGHRKYSTPGGDLEDIGEHESETH